MTPQRLLTTAIRPALLGLERLGVPGSVPAQRFLLAIALQESGLQHRRQVTASGDENGPATSYWQGEITGGMCLTLKHRATASMIRQSCDDFDIEPTSKGLWTAMQFHDIIAATAARLLVYTLPDKLPETAAEGWEQYISAWRPSKPKKATWAGHWKTATLAVED